MNKCLEIADKLPHLMRRLFATGAYQGLGAKPLT